jgi:hypothetical protein
MDIRSFWNISLSRLLFKPPQPRSPYIFRTIHESRPYVHPRCGQQCEILIWVLEWQWDQLRIMKVGGNESATKFFQSNGGTAALNSKDPTTKYTSNAATKYKDELKRRSARDAAE